MEVNFNRKTCYCICNTILSDSLQLNSLFCANATFIAQLWYFFELLCVHCVMPMSVLFESS